MLVGEQSVGESRVHRAAMRVITERLFRKFLRGGKNSLSFLSALVQPK